MADIIRELNRVKRELRNCPMADGAKRAELNCELENLKAEYRDAVIGMTLAEFGSDFDAEGWD